jgi:hypothetical protein
MIFSREYVGYLARHTVKHLIDAKMIQTAKRPAVEERVYQGLLDELSLEDRNTIRQEARKALEHLLVEEMRIDQAARQKIESQRRIIPEGSQEWDILYRKYYNEEVKKLGI